METPPFTFADLQAARDAGSVHDLHPHIERLTSALGFKAFMVAAMLISNGEEPVVHVMDNAPHEHRHRLLRSMSDRHPLFEHMQRTATPLVWDRDTFESADAMDKWALCELLGIEAGVALAIHLPRGRHLFAVFGAGQTIPAGQAEALTAWTLLMVNAIAGPSFRLPFTQDQIRSAAVAASEPYQITGLTATNSLLAKSAGMDNPHDLTSREIEALEWVTLGKTHWETGQILKISQHTVARHITNAKSKLGVTTIQQASMLALKLGIVKVPRPSRAKGGTD